MRSDFLFVEKYRPKKISDCILPKTLEKTFGDIVDKDEIPNLLLIGSAGCGKTTVAKALCDELNRDVLFINASENGNIDTLRTTIRNFASAVSLNGGKKVVILDEFDYSNCNTTQPALRGFIEEFSSNCTFILTCNYKNRIIEPLHSRCSSVEFKIPPKEKPELAIKFLKRIKDILELEKIKYENDKVLVQLITRYFPDYRKILNELQKHASSGIIDSSILTNLQDISLKELVSAMKEKVFSDVRKWVVNNLDNEPLYIYRKIYDSLYEILKPISIPKAILIIAQYQYQAAFCADQEINLTACLTEIMLECEFK